MEQSNSINEGAWIAVVKEGRKDRLSVGGVVGWGRGALIVKSPVGISIIVAALEDHWDQVRLLRAEVVAAVVDPDTPESAVATAGCWEDGFFFWWGQRGEDERWPTTLQVRHVFSEHIHHA